MKELLQLADSGASQDELSAFYRTNASTLARTVHPRTLLKRLLVLLVKSAKDGDRWPTLTALLPALTSSAGHPTNFRTLLQEDLGRTMNEVMPLGSYTAYIVRFWSPVEVGEWERLQGRNRTGIAPSGVEHSNAAIVIPPTMSWAGADGGISQRHRSRRRREFAHC